MHALANTTISPIAKSVSVRTKKMNILMVGKVSSFCLRSEMLAAWNSAFFGKSFFKKKSRVAMRTELMI